ncbi:MAG: Mur ligase domain-containing protein, partial [Candidatus Regiella insecticola]|nr:Mur ligase domain-containing protein [Candidatus Regiella insecticola]
IALFGHQKDGRHYISQAIAQGATAVIAEAQGQSAPSIPTQQRGGLKCEGYITTIQGVPIVYLNHLNQHLSKLAGQFYHQPGARLKVVGV